MPTKLILPGQTVRTSGSYDPSLDPFLNVEVYREQVIDSTVRGGVRGAEVEIEAEDTDIVELEWQTGVKQWVSVDQLRDDLRRAHQERGDGADVIRIPLQPTFGPHTRGPTEWVLKALKILRISPAEELARLTAQEIVAHFEDKLTPGPGLYFLTDPAVFGGQVRDSGELTGDDAWLVLIHGTASMTSASFNGLSGTDEWAKLREAYGSRILAFNHRTLSQSPIENAIELARLLPTGAKLHLITHSRGGLVGELLCLRPLDEQDLRQFSSAGRDRDVEWLRTLATVLAEKQFRVERFVRVACPARGTLLASKRADLYLSIILNLLGHVSGLAAHPIYAFVKATLLELAQRRTKADEIPGLEAQMPESPVIHLLNRSGVSVKADLGVIAGDIQGEGFLGYLKVFATDVFYREDHDLVVNTAAMYGGMIREQGGYYFLDRGATVDHFSYFKNDISRRNLLHWLTRAANQPPDSAFQKIERERRATRDLTLTRAAPTDLPIVFLLPGLMGSHLNAGPDRIWLDYDRLAQGDFERLARLDDGVQPGGIVAAPYEALTVSLQSRYQVIPFAYDWRRSMAEEATRLAALVRQELARHHRPIRFLAHSMGGLIARAMIAQDGALWNQLCARGGRLVMLGTPNQGMYSALRMLLGQEPIVRLLDLLDFSHTRADLLKILRGYPGLVQLLPVDLNGRFLTAEWWQQMGVEPPDAALLTQARDFHQQLRAAVDPQHMVYVAGTAPLTPGGITFDDGQPSFTTAEAGDGWVTYALGELNEVKTWYMDAAHGDLASHPKAFAALIELLDTGQTDRLATAPSGTRASIAPPPLTGAEPLLFPTEEELVAAAFGGTISPQDIEDRLLLRVLVSHGDLRQARDPVLVGHYQGDTIVSVEKLLDRQLNGRLSQRFHMNLYPGEVGTTEIFLDPDAKPPGALIIGLGDVGEITVEKVRQGVTNAALKYALACADGQGREKPSQWQSIGLSTLLLGRQGGNGLSVEQSLVGIISGVIRANRVLRDRKLWDRVRITSVECIELYEDMAIRAISALRIIADRPPINLETFEDLRVAAELLVLEGGLSYQPLNDETGWWRRLQITTESDRSGAPGSHLKFIALTDRARAEETLCATQRPLVDAFVRDVIGQSCDPNITIALFELLLPNTIKDQMRYKADLVLIVDNESAQYPWELLSQRTDNDIKPLATQFGLIRQFKTQGFRTSPQSTRDNNVLIIGDTESGYSELRGAQDEARAVNEVFKDKKYESRCHIRAKALTVISELFARDYRILHLAGHGIYQPDDPTRSGMILGDQIFLTSAEICQLRTVPDLVFINCCHLGKIDDTPAVTAPHRLAASIAQELINIGVRVVVAAGWAVDDQAALTFATTFYQCMLAGQTFGRAVHQARITTDREHRMTNTWGAYQCYGNPDFVLEQQDGDIAPITSRRQVLDQLSKIAVEARSPEEQRKAELPQELAALYDAVRPDWRDGDLLAAFGKTWSALGDFDQAIACYRDAIQQLGFSQNVGLTARISTIEQLANLLSRIPPHRADSAELFEESNKWLEWLLALGRTGERLSMLGGSYKRLARIKPREERRGLFEQARDYYKEAYEVDFKQKKYVNPYPTLNWVTFSFLIGGHPQEELITLIDSAAQVALELEREEPTYWNRVTQPDAELLKHLVCGDLAKHTKAIIKLYQHVIEGGATARELASTRDQLTFLIEMLDSQSPETVRALKKIRDTLGANTAQT